MAQQLRGWDDGKIYYWDEDEPTAKEICVNDDPILFGKLVELVKEYKNNKKLGNVSTKRKLADVDRLCIVKRSPKCSCGNDIFLRIYDPFGLGLMCWNCDKKIGNYMEIGLPITDSDWEDIKKRF